MNLAISRVRRTRDAGEPPRWELARARSHPRLQPWVESYTGYWERGDGPLVRREVPVPRAILILDFGPLLGIVDPADAGHVTAHAAGFVAGLSETFTLTRHEGLSQGIQVDLTPIGAHRLTGVSAQELSGVVLGLADVFGAGEGPALTERLQDTPSWEARFDVLDRFLLERLDRSRAVPSAVTVAWRRILESEGKIAVGDLSRELGISRKHLISGFRERVGLTPKVFAQVVRFDATIKEVLAHAGHGTKIDWAGLAGRRGYSDQAHLVREIRRFAGYSPNELLRHVLPELGGIG